MQESNKDELNKETQESPDILVDISNPAQDEHQQEEEDGQSSRSLENSNIVDSISLSSDDSISGHIRRHVPGINCPEKIVCSVLLS